MYDLHHAARNGPTPQWHLKQLYILQVKQNGKNGGFSMTLNVVELC